MALQNVWVQPGSDGFPEAPGPFSFGVRSDNLVMTSGRASVSETGQTLGVGDIRVQTERVIENCRAVLQRLGATLGDVVRVTIWLKDFEHYREMNEVYAKFFTAPYPVRSCVRADLVKPQWLVEMEMTAVVSPEPNPPIVI
jgi:aminoacrylate peracid reductase